MENIHSEIAKYSKTLMFKEPFYGLFLIGLNKKISKNIQTACVCRENINTSLMINPEFWSKQDEMTKVAVLKHELLHIAFHHLSMIGEYNDRELLNISADLEINQFIQNEFKGPTWDGLEYNEGIFKELNLPVKAGTRKYYELLDKEIKECPDGDVAKFHSALKEANGSGTPIKITLEDGTEVTVMGSHEMWKEFEGLSEADKKLIAKQIDHQLKEAAEQTTRSRGLIPSELEEYIKNLYEVEEPVIDWKAYLRRFNGMSIKVITKKTRRKPSRRFSDNPALRIKPRKNTLIAIDTSGSVSNQDLVEFFNEIYHIYKTGTDIDIIECDAEIQRVYKYKGNRDEISVKGRGGTSFDPVLEYLSEHKDKYQNLIYLTDGECSTNITPIKPVLWVFCEKGRFNEDLPGAKVQIKR